LIELLVVIAIIAILAAILFPVFAQAREASRKASCISNLKQIGMATQMYCQDFDEQLQGYANCAGGPYTFADGTSSACELWWHPLYPYMKNQQARNCPSSRFALNTQDPGPASLYSPLSRRQSRCWQAAAARARAGLNRSRRRTQRERPR
jgi:type II secretory pathway pseudopilin PulG